MFAQLIDITRCTGCEQCVEACSNAHQLEQEKSDQARALARDGLNEYRLSTVVALGGGHFARKSCMHCIKPSCVSACLVGGLKISSEGAVLYDPGKCIGCRYCMLACPFHIPRYQWSQTIPFVQKCDFCYEKIHQGERPACADICPNDAIYFGEREDVLHTARLRIQRDPDRYLPKIWGETEFGGTSMLYISDVPLEKLGWPHNVTSPIPEITDPLISLTPQIGLSVFTGSFALKWIIDRRNRLQHAGTNPKKH